MTQRYITEIHLENFQDHKDTKISLKSGLNLITGTSDAGKSAILRAINFVFHNLPRGDKFIRHGTKEASVSITFSDNTVVQRIKGRNDKNAYLIIPPSGIVEGYDRIGGDVPLAVQKYLGNPPIDDKHGPLSYAEQMSPLFLVSLSSTELPRALSELTGINDLEEAAQLLSKRARSADRQAKDSETRTAQYNEDLEQYNDLDSEISKMEEIHTRLSAIDEETSYIQKAKLLQERHQDVISHGKEANKALVLANKIIIFSEDVKRLNNLRDKIYIADNLISSYNSCDDKIKESETTLAKTNSIVKLSSNIDSLKEISKSIDSANQVLQSFSNLNKKGLSIKTEKDEWNQIIKNKNLEKESLIKKMKSDGLWCTACNRPLTKEDHEDHK